MGDQSVLVVEESSIFSDLVRDLLEAASFSVTQAPTAKDALALLGERTFDLPKVGGFGLLGSIRALPNATTMPVLLMTAKGRENEEPPESSPLPNDYILKPIDPVDLITRVRAATGRATLPASMVAAAAPAGDQPSAPRSKSVTGGKIITVFSLKGGVGASTIAVNLAVTFQRLWSEPTALVDLNLEAAGLNILLDIMPTSTLDELVVQDGNMTAESIGQYLIAHKSGVSLLSAPATPERAELVSAAGVRKVLGLLKDTFDYVVIDTACTFAEHTLIALELSDHVVMPVIADISSVKAATTTLDIFAALNISEDRVVPVLNELIPKVGLSRKHVESSIHMPVTPIPFGGGKVTDSVNLGAPIALTEPDSPFSHAIQALAYELSRPESKTKQQPQQSDLLSKVRKRLRVT